jgi:hypothetical protein
MSSEPHTHSPCTNALVAEIERLGYRVSIHHVAGAAEVHAVPLQHATPENTLVIRTADVDSNAAQTAYTAVCVLAERLQIRLEA